MDRTLNATRLIQQALAYRDLSRKMREAVARLRAGQSFEELARGKPVNLHEISRGEAVAVSNRIGAVVRHRVVDNNTSEARRPAADPIEALLDREAEAFAPLATPAAEQEGAAPPDPDRLAAEIDDAALAEIARVLDPEANHQLEYAERLAVCALALHRRGDTETNAAFEPVFRIWRAQAALTEEASGTVRRFAPSPPDGPDESDGPVDPPPSYPEEPAMPPDDMPHRDAIADAISRLQDSMSQLASGPAASPLVFDRHLEDLQYSALNVPALTGEGARGLGSRQMADKIVAGLARAVERIPGELGPRYAFNPGRIKLHDVSGAGARGGAAVIAREVAAYHGLYLQRLRELAPERCLCDPREADRLIEIADETLAELTAEAEAATGPIGPKADALLHRLAHTTVTLAERYGLETDTGRVGMSSRAAAFLSEAGGFDGEEEAGPRLTSVLDEDVNDQAWRSVLRLFDRITQLFDPEQGSAVGARYARLLARIDALPPSVHDLRQALRRAGLSGIDQKATFAGDDGAPIELDRLLGWVEASAARWRGDLVDGRITRHGLQWIAKSLSEMTAAMTDLGSDRRVSPLTANLPDNSYGAARREIRELSAYLEAAQADARYLARGRVLSCTTANGGSDD